MIRWLSRFVLGWGSVVATSYVTSVLRLKKARFIDVLLFFIFQFGVDFWSIYLKFTKQIRKVRSAGGALTVKFQKCQVAWLCMDKNSLQVSPYTKRIT